MLQMMDRPTVVPVRFSQDRRLERQSERPVWLEIVAAPEVAGERAIQSPESATAGTSGPERPVAVAVVDESDHESVPDRAGGQTWGDRLPHGTFHRHPGDRRNPHHMGFGGFVVRAGFGVAMYLFQRRMADQRQQLAQQAVQRPAGTRRWRW